MSAYERANKILANWLSGDSASMTRDLERAVLAHFERLVASLEEEERELLASISCDLLAVLTTQHTGASKRAQSCFALLRHLCTRSPQTLHPANRVV